MEEKFIQDSVRSRLLLSGLKELEEHGAGDFSLRRVAQAAGVSCAAPYRHFKDKDELIGAVISFVLEGWTLLSAQIFEIFSNDTLELVTEFAVAGLRFWIANGNFRTVIMVNAAVGAGHRGALLEFDRPIADAVRLYCAENGITDAERATFKLLSIIYGAVILVDGGYESADKAADNLRAVLSSGL